MEAWRHGNEAELEAQMAATADLEDALAAAAEELVDAQDKSKLSRERAKLQREWEGVAQLERRVAHLEQELESSSQERKGMTHLEGRIQILKRKLSDIRCVR